MVFVHDKHLFWLQHMCVTSNVLQLSPNALFWSNALSLTIMFYYPEILPLLD